MVATHLAKPLGYLALALALIPRVAFAQTDTASIVGTVKDGSGAVMPGVTVTATQASTDVALTATTNASGQYVFPTLRIGVYTVAAELQGFRRAVRADVQLNVQDRVEINLVLEVGQLAEEVVVKGETPLLQTQTADIGYVVDERQVARSAAARPALCGARVSRARRGDRAGGHHEPRRGHVLQRQRQLRDVEQLHARRRGQQLVVDQPAGAQPAGRCSRRSMRCRSSRSRRAPTPRSSARRPARSSTRRSSRAATSSAAACSSSSATRRSTPTPGTTIAAGRAKGPFNQHIAGRHARRPDRPRPHVLLRRLPGDADRAGAVADLTACRPR